MTDDQLNTFLDAVRSDASLRDRLRLSSDGETVIAIARAAGFVLTKSDLEQAKLLISDKELEAIRGGANAPSIGYCNTENCAGTVPPLPSGSPKGIGI